MRPAGRRPALGAALAAAACAAGLAACGLRPPPPPPPAAPRPAAAAQLPAGWIDVSAPPYGCRGDGVADDTACLQAALDAGYGGRVIIPRGQYRFRGPLRIEPLRGGRSALPIIVQGDGFDANGGSGGTVLRNEGPGPGIDLRNDTGRNADNLVLLTGFSLVGDGQDRPGGDGIVARRVNNLNLRDLWVQDQRESGVVLEDCWGASLDNVTILRSRRHGLHLLNRFNMGVVRRVRAYANGRIYDGVHANILASAEEPGAEHLGPRLEQVDVSYAGSAPFPRGGAAEGTEGPRVLRLEVRGGRGRLLTAGPHGLWPGAVVALRGAPEAAGVDEGLPYTVEEVPGATELVLRLPGARPGAWSDRRLRLRPFAVGLLVEGTYGLAAESVYAEDCAGLDLWIRRASGFAVVGGFFQNQAARIEDSDHGRVSGAYFRGRAGGLRLAGDPRSEVDVGGDNRFADGARLEAGPVWKRDGRYLSRSPPAAGAWYQGDLVWNAAPGPGSPPAWVCTADGTPGSWSALGAAGR